MFYKHVPSNLFFSLNLYPTENRLMLMNSQRFHQIQNHVEDNRIPEKILHLGIKMHSLMINEVHKVHMDE